MVDDIKNFKDFVPFESKRLDEEKTEDKSFVMSIRINEQERLMIEQARKLLNVESDTKALKMIAEIGLNVIQATFGEKMLRYLSDSKRERKTDYERGYKRKNDVL